MEAGERKLEGSAVMKCTMQVGRRGEGVAGQKGQERGEGGTAEAMRV